VKRRLALALAAATLSGCTLAPPDVRPAPAVPSAWPTGSAYPQAGSAQPSALSYREVFRDPQLAGLIERALSDNQDLRAALENVELARARYHVRRADLLPHLEAGFSAVESRSGAASGLSGAGAGAERMHQADLSLASFEIDLFGRLRSLSRSAFEQYLATAENARGARLTLAAEVARAYFALAADRSLLVVSTDTVASAERTVALTRARLQGGVAPRTDLTQAETLLDQARSDREQRLTQVAQDRNALELLVGGPIADAALPSGIEAVDGLVAEVPAGLDSRILLRRPDVVAAEHLLRAANAEIGAARAAFFPTVSLTGLAGVASPALSTLFDSGRSTWAAEGAASAPIFRGGGLVAGLAGAQAQRRQAVAGYQSAIQSAFRDVADALARRGTMEAQLAAQRDLLAAATTGYDLEIARYRAGVEPFLSTLVAQRTLYAARQSLATARLTRAQNLATLYEALGADPLITTPSRSARRR